MERYILEALQKAVARAVAASSLDTLPVKYVGIGQDPEGDDKWLEVIYIPNNRQGEFWSEGKTYRGVLRLILHWPLNSEGVYEPIDLIKSIADYFEKGSKLQDPAENVTLTITEEPNVMDVIETAPNILIPASIRYSFFSS